MHSDFTSTASPSDLAKITVRLINLSAPLDIYNSCSLGSQHSCCRFSQSKFFMVYTKAEINFAHWQIWRPNTTWWHSTIWQQCLFIQSSNGQQSMTTVSRHNILCSCIDWVNCESCIPLSTIWTPEKQTIEIEKKICFKWYVMSLHITSPPIFTNIFHLYLRLKTYKCLSEISLKWTLTAK